MKKYIALCILLIAAAVYAIPPSPPQTSVQGLSVTSGKTLTVTENATISGALGTAAYVATSTFQAASANLTTLAGNVGSNLTDVTAIGLSGSPNIDVNNLTVAGTANVTGVAWTGLDAANITGLRTDNSGAGNIPYIDAGGNVANLGLLNGLVLTGGNLTIPNPVVTSLSVSGNVFMAVAANGSNAPSGTPVVITVYDVATNTPYYFYAYPNSGIE
jgi:hypothetical protein